MAGSNGTPGQVLTSNGSSNVYWSTISGGGGSVNTASVYFFTNTISFGNSTANTTVSNSSLITSNGYIQSQFIQTNIQSGTTYTFVNTDSGTLIQSNSATSVVFTVPSTLPANSRILVTQLGAGSVTIANAAGVTLGSRTGSYTIGNQYGTISIFMANSSLAIIDGNLGNTSSAGVNTYAQYTWTNTQTFSANVYFSANINVTSANIYTTNATGTVTVTPVSVTIAANATSNLVVGNSTIYTTVNSSAFSYLTAFIANATGVYHTGTINAASYTISTTFVANTLGLYHTGLVNAASYNTGATGTGTGGILANTTSITIGNNTINTFANSSYLRLGTSNVITTTTTAGGYTTLPNGLTMLWGSLTTANTTAQVVTFSTTTGKTLTSNAISAVVTMGTANVVGYVTTINSTAITIISNSATASTARWLVLGV